MSELLGDLRGKSEASVLMAQESLRTLDYVVASDSDDVGLEPGFRSDVLPVYAELLTEDSYDIPPKGRLRTAGLVEYVVRDGSPRLLRDFAIVPMPVWSGNGSAEPRIYRDGLPILDFSHARSWLEGVLTLTLPKLQEPQGFLRVHLFETGHDGGKVVEGEHQDGELVVGSFPRLINGDGAETTLHRPVPLARQIGRPALELVTTFKLAVGDVSLHYDVGLWHDVSKTTPPSDGSDPRRQSFVFGVLSLRTNQWLKEMFDSGQVSSGPPR